jgi:magnesium chelatase subunit I
MLVATANPEDYTNRGRIITPLKDRFGSQIRTHYPPDVDTELAIVRQEARPPALLADGPRVQVPGFMAEIVAELSQLARESSQLSQRSGVSVRLTIANYETLAAVALRRALRLGEPDAVPRVSDLGSLIPSTEGKVEIEALEEGREERILQQLLSAAVLAVFRRRVPQGQLPAVVAAFDSGADGLSAGGPDGPVVVHAGDDLPASAYLAILDSVPALEAPVMALSDGESPACLASSVELVLEGLHLTKRLNKDAVGGQATYRGRG